MERKSSFRPVFPTRITTPALTFILLIIVVFFTACNLPATRADDPKEFADRNARMYQMYFDTSADPAQNELQVRRFIGHLRLADLEAIFGDIQSLPMDGNCNYAGGPVVDDEGIRWYATITPDLVGVNLISVAPDGTRSSAFDLDGDRIVDILDMRFSDNRRISFAAELMGLEVFREWLQGNDPFCNTEVARQLGLPDLGCNERGTGPSGGGGGGFAGSGIIDPVEMLCSDYDTGPMADIMVRNPNRSGFFGTTNVTQQTNGSIQRTVVTINWYNEAGQFVGTDKLITIFNIDDPDAIAQVISETVDSQGNGYRESTVYYGNGAYGTLRSSFTVAPQDRGRPNYDDRRTTPPDVPPAPLNTGEDTENNDGNGQGSTGQEDIDNPASDQNNPGPEGSDMAVAEFCRNRANHRSGIEEATEQDPTSIGVSCSDLVGAPNRGNCIIIEWARPEDFNGVLQPPAAGDECDAFNDPDRRCEGESIDDRIRRFRGLTTELWSLDLPEFGICSPLVCDPAQSVELQTYAAGGIEIACPEIDITPTLEPSEENCPPGTYYAPVTNRCIAIQIPQGGGGNGGNGGNDGGGGTCNLSTSACTSQGLSFDQNKCECVPIQ